jgi:hypothetical protein
MITLRLQRTLAAVAGTALIAIAGGALAQQQPIAAKSAVIVIENFKFVPQTLTVAPARSGRRE